MEVDFDSLILSNLLDSSLIIHYSPENNKTQEIGLISSGLTLKRSNIDKIPKLTLNYAKIETLMNLHG